MVRIYAVVIWLASFPRSGNSYFRVVSKTLFDQEIYSVYPENNKQVNASELEAMMQENKVYLVKTHELPPDSSPAIYLVRDGRDALVSLAWFQLASSAKPNRKISRRKYTRRLKQVILSNEYGGWSDNCLTWLRRTNQTVIVRFEHLTSQPEEVVANALKAVGLSPQRSGQLELPSFKKLQSFNPVLYRKGKIGDWKEQMPNNLQRLFWKKHEEGMRLLGYKD